MKRDTVLKHAPTAIIIAALLVSAPRLAAALAFVEPPFLGLPVEALTGPAFGLTTMGATVYVWHVYQERKRLSLAKWLPVGWCILLGLIALILVPGMVLEIRSGPLASLLVPPLDVAWCIALSLASELVVALAALTHAIAEPKQKKKTQEPATETQSEKDNGHKPASCTWCGGTFGSKQGVNAHLRFCEAYQEHKESEEIAQ